MPVIPRKVTPRSPAQRISEANAVRFLDTLTRQRNMVSTWEMYLSYGETQDRIGDEGMGVIGEGIPEWHLRCILCGQSVIRVYTGGNPIAVSVNDILDRFTAHAKQAHERILPDGEQPEPEQRSEDNADRNCHCDPAADGGNTCPDR